MSQTAALVVGASKGLGRSCVLAMAEAGERSVVGTFHLDRDGMDVTSAMARELGCEVHGVQVDLADRTSVEELRRSVDDLGWSVKSIVHSGSTGNWVPLIQARARALRRIVNVMGFGLITLTAAFRDHLVDNRGSVIGISSLGSVRAIPFYGPVAMAKASLEASARYLAVEMQPHGVRVNCVRPGVYESASLRAAPMADAMKALFASKNVFGRDLEMTDITDVVLWFLDDSSEAITGQVVNIDAGWNVSPI